MLEKNFYLCFRQWGVISLLLAIALKSASQTNIDSLSALLNKPAHDTVKLKLLVDLSEECEPTDIYKYGQPAVILADKLLADKRTLNRKLILQRKALALNNIGYLYEQRGQIKIALNYYSRSLKIREKIQDKVGIGESYNNIGNTYKNQGKNKEAYAAFNYSLKMAQEVQDKFTVAVAYNNIADLFEEQGQIKTALDYYHRSLKIREEIQDKYGIANSLNNIGCIYDTQGQLTDALDNYMRSLKLMEDIMDKQGIATALNNIGTVYQRQGKNKQALEYYNRSFEIGQKIQDKKTIAGILNNCAFIYLNDAELLTQQGASWDSTNMLYEEAVNNCQRALKINEEIQDKEGITFSLFNIGSSLLKQRKNRAAKLYADSSLSIAKQGGYAEHIKKAELLLTGVDSSLQNYLGAYEHYKQFIIYRDSITNQESRKMTIQKQMQYEFDKKENSIKAEQDKKNTIIKAEKRRQKIILYAVSGGLLLVVGFGSFAFHSLRTTRKQNKLIETKSRETEEQKKIIEEKNKDITDSINYAQRIQKALLASDTLLHKNLGEHFVMFRPKAIVSGDFYWAVEKENRFYLAVCDCTGHGVPGAFMSLLNISFLNEAIVEKGIKAPNEILNHVRQRLIENFSAEGARDGMDGVLVCFDKNKKEISYSAAHNAPILVTNGALTELPSDNMPVGLADRLDTFKLEKINFVPASVLYLYTDGYADQFGGPKGKKFKYKQLNALLLENSSKPIKEQKLVFEKTFENWKGDLEQIDDVLLIGIKI